MLFILLPAYNEEKSFELLIPNIANHLKRDGFEFRIVVCNDGSNDGSAKVLDKLGRS